MHKVQKENPVVAPSRVACRGVGRPAAQFLGFSRRGLVLPGGEPLTVNPELDRA